MGDEADDGGAHEDAEVAECADGRHSEADGHDTLLAEQGEEDGHDVGAADADGEEAEVEQHRLSGEDDEQEAGDGQQAATDDDALLAELLHGPVAEQAHRQHGRREDGEGRSGEGHVEVAHGRQEDTAPVHDGALDEEGDAGNDADEGHDALRQREQLAAGIAAIG